uniref:Gamma-soluble NSF attachment protein n=1 Tax=Cicer arietinum TaxID=3827 RepID=A0A3Q7XEF3_CICAR|nr:gamma-soluble NSF attachment protein-like [Cicer arietinum]
MVLAGAALNKKQFALEDSLPEEAIKLYTDACTILEEDGGEQMAFDLYRAATSVYIKLEKAAHMQAYLSAIIVYLYAQDFKQAEKCYNDCSQIDGFLRSDHGRCASKLLSAFKDGDIEDIKRITQSSTISNIDHVIIRLARKLPMGDVNAMKAHSDTTKEEEEPLDENDLT